MLEAPTVWNYCCVASSTRDPLCIVMIGCHQSIRIKWSIFKKKLGCLEDWTQTCDVASVVGSDEATALVKNFAIEYDIDSVGVVWSHWRCRDFLGRQHLCCSWTMRHRYLDLIRNSNVNFELFSVKDSPSVPWSYQIFSQIFSVDNVSVVRERCAFGTNIRMPGYAIL